MSTLIIKERKKIKAWKSHLFDAFLLCPSSSCLRPRYPPTWTISSIEVKLGRVDEVLGFSISTAGNIKGGSLETLSLGFSSNNDFSSLSNALSSGLSVPFTMVDRSSDVVIYGWLQTTVTKILSIMSFIVFELTQYRLVIKCNHPRSQLSHQANIPELLALILPRCMPSSKI